MANFSNITIVGIHGNGGIKNFIPSVEKTAKALPGAKTLLITDELVDTIHPQKKCGRLTYASYSHFVVYALHSFVDTDFCLIVQDDGWALNGENWDSRWLDYDYVGGLTHAGLVGNKFHKHYNWVGLDNPLVVQNGGFSLRSKRFLEAPSRYGIMMVPQSEPELNNEDVQLCCILRRQLEAIGMKFCPDELSKYFAFEHLDNRVHKDIDITKIFGHHSKFRQLISDNEMLWRLSENDTKMIMNEDKVLNLFKTYGYTINGTSTTESQAA